jgi:uncharacterized protein
VSDYEAGDVNVAGAPTAEAVVTYIVEQLAEDPQSVKVTSDQVNGKVVLSVAVSPDDMGRIIGRRGRTAQALRTLAAAAGSRDGVTTSVDILD